MYFEMDWPGLLHASKCQSSTERYLKTNDIMASLNCHFCML